ncbi:MAG: GDP-mannose 4,6-dehydratase [Cellvibrionales bacterium TMED122]|nr:MAG: GDP-mannose 4,6-dehydratase [Cellvibrionales bacterium TMED122]|tara:strand:- start:5032 stop:6108 length:1077 start_codon:yes stop_codon:yes gene_type:complete
MKNKVAFITGVTGQDGSYLAELLLQKNYIVHGLKRKSSSINTERVDHIYYNRKYRKKFFLHYGDLTDRSSINKLLITIKPDEIYNLAAQSHVAVSFQMPEYTSQVNAIGFLNIIETARSINKKIKIYQASTSELYGLIQRPIQNEKTPFYPRSPYSTSKLFSYWISKNYRESYGMFISNGILFNHESPRRGETFVTRKITIGLSRIIGGLDNYIELGNLYAMRDWGHAKEYAKMQWQILQKNKPDDFVISTGKNFSIKYFFSLCCKILGLKIKWSGKGLNEIARLVDFNKKKYKLLNKNQILLKVNKKYFRPNEVDILKGDSSKARKLLNWRPTIKIEEIAKEMLINDMKKVGLNEKI